MLIGCHSSCMRTTYIIMAYLNDQMFLPCYVIIYHSGIRKQKWIFINRFLSIILIHAEDSAEQEPAWLKAGQKPGIQIWRIVVRNIFAIHQ